MDTQPATSGAPARAGHDDRTRVLGIVAELAEELHPGRSTQVGLDRTLDTDLGFDSLSRAELLLRIERAAGVRLPEELLATAETPRDLLRAMCAARPEYAEPPPPPPPPSVAPAAPSVLEAIAAPEDATTLVEVLAWHVARHPERPHVHLYEHADAPAEVLTYAAMDRAARRVAAALTGRGLAPGESIAIMLPTGRDYLATFLGVLLAGAVPVPIYPPARPSQLEDHLRRHGRILDSARATRLITVPAAERAARLLRGQAESLREILTTGDLDADPDRFEPPPVRPGDTAFVQFTSGSTGQPKGVVLAHANILANIRAMGRATGAGASDVFVSWLPLYHDMGLIGAWLGSLYYAMQAVLMSPLSFLAGPERWLWTIHRHRATLSAAPNFAYELCLSKIPDPALEGLDLGSWRRAFNGAEPVSPLTVREFSARFRPYGFDPAAMAPVYGLAEAAVGLAFPPLGRGPIIDRIRRTPLERSGRAVPAGPDDPDAIELVGCGQPLPGYEIRIVGGSGREVGEREEGRLEFRGPSATSGYLRNPEATAALFDGGWLDSGDLAYVAEGELYFTGRVKDVIIRGGRNIFPYEVEEAVGALPAIRKGCVAVFGSTDASSGTERLVVMAEIREAAPDRLPEITAEVNRRVNDVLGMPPDDVVLVAPRTVLKTSSGKIRRAASRALYERGELGRPRPVAMQIARLALSGLARRARGAQRRLGERVYGVYGQGLFLALALPVWVAIALCPSTRWRWAILRAGVRGLFAAARIPLLVRGAPDLPPDQARIYVANHASYLDGAAAVAALPGRFSFIAKSELASRFISRIFLNRIGARLFERWDREQSLADARSAVAAARRGESLFFFAEGGLRREQGLRGFRLGAFVAAAEAGVPVVPVTIRGTRSVLRGGSWFPRRGTLTVVVSEPLHPDGSDWAAAVRLRDAARERVLRHLGEPDVASR